MALADSLVSYWSLGEASGNAIDSHGSNTLTDNNTVGSATGKVGNCRDFETSSSEYFSHADSADFSRGDTGFTFALWVQFESLSSFSRVFSKVAVSNYEYGLYIRDPLFNGTYDFRWFVSDSGAGETTTAVSTSPALATGTWYFVCVWHDSSANQIGLSVNAGTAFTASHSTGVYNGTAAFQMGAETISGYYHDGLIDEFGLWGRVLTSDERTELYNSGNGRDYAYITGGAAGQPAVKRMGGVRFGTGPFRGSGIRGW